MHAFECERTQARKRVMHTSVMLISYRANERNDRKGERTVAQYGENEQNTEQMRRDMRGTRVRIC